LQLGKRFSIVNQKAHDALADVNALWDVIKRLLYPKIDSADKVADDDAEDRLMNCYACSESFKTFPAELRKGARVICVLDTHVGRAARQWRTQGKEEAIVYAAPPLAVASVTYCPKAVRHAELLIILPNQTPNVHTTNVSVLQERQPRSQNIRCRSRSFWRPLLLLLQFCS